MIELTLLDQLLMQEAKILFVHAAQFVTHNQGAEVVRKSWKNCGGSARFYTNSSLIRR